MLCGIFALSFLAGGVVNTIYADDNADLVLKRTGACKYYNEITYHDYTEVKEYCKDIKRVRDSQAAAAVSCEVYVHTYMNAIKLLNQSCIQLIHNL